MMKRCLDLMLVVAALPIVVFLILPAAFLVYLQDRKYPFYLAPRVGRNGKNFTMVKLRSMIVNADKAKVDSTSSDDRRITRVGHFIRRCKLDELTQLWNVFRGEMSFVGPRPNVRWAIDLYTEEEKKLLTAKPGITDFASIVFSDEGEILRGSLNADQDYFQLIHPWKSRLALFYVKNSSAWLDLQIIFLTALTIVSRARALKAVQNVLVRYEAPQEMIQIAGRTQKLIPTPPPGSDQIVFLSPTTR